MDVYALAGVCTKDDDDDESKASVGFPSGPFSPNMHVDFRGK